MEIDKKTWKKILFLDIDGVLASHEFLIKTGGKSGFIDKEKVALLNKLKPYNVEVVISSSWGYNEDTVNTLISCGLELPIMSDWDYGRLKIAPCRYYGSVRGENLVLMAHNYI